MLIQPIVFMESQLEVMKISLSEKIAFCSHYLHEKGGYLQIRFSMRYFSGKEMGKFIQSTDIVLAFKRALESDKAATISL